MIALRLRGVGYASHRLHFFYFFFLTFYFFIIYYLFYFIIFNFYFLLFYLERKTTEPSCRFVSDSWVSWLQFYQVVLVKHVGVGRVFWCQPSLPSQESSVPALPNFGLLLYLCLHRRTTKFGLVTHGEGRVFRSATPLHLRQCVAPFVSDSCVSF